MNDHDALLRAICENPREDTPRLAFADWLDENGQPERAAFIRSDIAMSLRDEWDAERIRWEEGYGLRVPKLWGWVGTLPLANTGGVTWDFFHRGFPSGICVRDLELLHARGHELFASHPLDSLSFSCQLPKLKRLVSEVWFSKVTRLEWKCGRYSGEVLQPLLEAANLGLRALAINGASINPKGARALFNTTILSRLVGLSLSGTGPHIVGVALESLHRTTSSCPLRALTFQYETLGGNLLILANHLPQGFRVLELKGNRINSEAAMQFADVPRLTELRKLGMVSNHIGNAGATAIFTSPQLAGLKVLDLSYCMVGDEALRALLENSPLADGLNLLNLTGSPASADMKLAVKERMGDRVRL